MDHLDEHPRFRRMANYLASKAPPGQLAARQDIEPTEIPDLLPWIMLIDVVRQSQANSRYRIRLVGTEVVDIQGSDATGKFVEEVLDSADAVEVIAGYDDMLRTHEAQYRSSMVATTGREHVSYRRIAFPLAQDRQNVDMFVFVFVRDD